ncbi:uncharacterized protein LOC120136477 [Hibiscus syriacus]|uniref:uncharacterized protein LOC120136477 n=1 Tax=Hibiscus syriacus TaxID=106335 RepID=UPI001924F736|nr:uncharacterized protein LOC120136477 [Hibiscus syriacus]
MNELEGLSLTMLLVPNVEFQETTLHILRDCPIAKSLWSLLLSLAAIVSYGRIGMLSSLTMIKKMLLPTLPEALWAKFALDCTSPPQALASDASLPLSWRKPPTAWFCLNTDASVSTSSGLGLIGGVIRDYTGNWMTGFHKCVGITNPLQAELWGVFTGLQIAWNYGIMGF